MAADSILPKHRILIFAAIAVNSVVWAIISVMKYNAYNAQVLDLGVNSALLYGVFHPAFASSQIAVNKLIYIVIAPFYNVYPDPRLLVVFQSVFLSMGAYPLFVISRIRLKDDGASILISLSYLLYFPLAGVYWYDFHFMALFPTFFLFGFLCYLQRRWKLLLLFMTLAAITDFLAPIILVFFAVFVYISERKNDDARSVIMRYSIPILSVALSLFLIVNIYFHFSYTIAWMNEPFSGKFFLDLASNDFGKLSYFVILLIPVGYLSVFAPEVLIMILPYILFAISHNYQPYVVPYYYQYPALTAPIIFVSAVFGLERIVRMVPKRLHSFNAKKIAATLLLLSVIFFVFVTPLGNMMTGSHYPYDERNQVAFTQNDASLNSMISMIPKGSTVLIQGNMPQITEGYHWILPEDLNMSNPPLYAISDPYSYFYNNSVPISLPNYSNFTYVFSELLSSGQYHVVKNENGIELIERNT